MIPDTFLLTLPDGKKVRCWTKDLIRIREDIQVKGTVALIRPDGGEVYDYVPPEEILPADARRIDSRDRRRG